MVEEIKYDNIDQDAIQEYDILILKFDQMFIKS